MKLAFGGGGCQIWSELCVKKYRSSDDEVVEQEYHTENIVIIVTVNHNGVKRKMNHEHRAQSFTQTLERVITR